MFVFFFFKQKTAYEIKECDWSSDVCSSDLISSAEFSLRRDFSTVPVSFRYILETRPRVSRNRFGIADVEA